MQFYSITHLLFVLGLITDVSLSHSAGCFFSGEVYAPVVSEAESDTEKGSTDGAGLVCSIVPESFVDAPTDLSDPATYTHKPHIPKVTSDSFISELVSDREPGKASKEISHPIVPVLEQELIPGEVAGDGAVVSPSQAGAPHGSQWSNVDLEEVQSQQTQTGLVPDSGDTCSLSSVATLTLAMEEPYAADDHPLWAWVSAGACNVDSHSQLNWFNCSLNTCELNEITRPLYNTSLTLLIMY